MLQLPASEVLQSSAAVEEERSVLRRPTTERGRGRQPRGRTRKPIARKAPKVGGNLASGLAYYCVISETQTVAERDRFEPSVWISKPAADMQLPPLLQPRRLRLDLVRLRERRDQRPRLRDLSSAQARK